MSDKTKALIVRNDAALTVGFTEEAELAKELAMDAASMVVAVLNPTHQKIAVDAQRLLANALSAVEKARKDVKAPILDYGRAIDEAAKLFVAKMSAEQARLCRLLGDYQQHEIAKAKAEEAARNKKLIEAEREREAELAKVSNLKEREVIHERFQQTVQAMPVAAAPPRVEGQTVREEWEFEITDKRLLYQFHPMFVELEPKRSEIKEALKAGLQVQGVRAWKVVNSSVRATPERRAIEV